MLKKMSVLLVMLGLTGLGGTAKVFAGCYTTTYCQSLCDEYCTSKTSTCKKATLNACDANGQQECSVLCVNGSGYHPTCSCSSPPGGSPIFKKQPTNPPPEPAKKDVKKDASKAKVAKPESAATGQCPQTAQHS